MCVFVLESYLYVHGIVFFAWEMNGNMYSFTMSFLGCGLGRHVVWMSRDRWPIRCLMANEVENGFYNAKLSAPCWVSFVTSSRWCP